MITYELYYRGHYPKKISFLHKIDLPNNAEIIYNPLNINEDSIGKYFRFNDGSKLYSKIIHIYGLRFFTESGNYHKKDAVVCAIPKRRSTNYSGVYNQDVHDLIKPYNKTEHWLASKIIKNETDKVRSKAILGKTRIRKLTRDKIKKELTDKFGIDADYFAQKLFDMADKKGQHQFRALKAMAYIFGIDFEEPRHPQLPNKQQPIFAQYKEVTVFGQDKKEPKEIPNEEVKAIENNAPTEIETPDFIDKDYVPTLGKLKSISKKIKKQKKMDE